MREADRLSRLSRISALVMLEEIFTPSEIKVKKEEREGFETASEMFPVQIIFSKEAAFQVMDFFAPEEIKLLADKSLIVNTAFPPGRWINSFILSFGAQAQVMEPLWLRKELSREAESICSLYKK